MAATETPRDLVRVLVVDDDSAIRQTYYDVLDDHGWAVATAASGRQALQTLMQQSFDVLVVDLKMEEMDGLVFLQEALKIWPWLGVVVVSAFISHDAVPRIRKLGVTRILGKPVDIETFIRNIADESAEKRHLKIDIPRANAIDLMRDHMKLLTGVSHRSASAETLAGALREFGQTLARMAPSDVDGILVAEQNESPVLLVTAQHEVSPVFLSRLQDEMIARFKSLSGHSIDKDNLQIRAEGAKCHAGAPDTIGSAVSVPLLLESEIVGLLTMASISERAYTPLDVSMLYHTANHISALFTALRKMHGLATRDPLTGVFNRIRLEEELDRAWQLSRRYGTPMGVVVVDIDNFKVTNDAYGHSIGDEVLRDFARVLRSAARTTDIIARYGGDEFVAILPRAREPDARAFGERLLARTREYAFCRSSHHLSLTVSIGVATSDNPTAPSTSSALLSQADRALFAAKRAGRNRLCIWPAGHGGAPDAEEAKTAGTLALPTHRPQAGARILLVEDEEPIRRLVALMLQKDHHAIVGFANAAETVREVKARPGHYDIMITDIGLPDKNGIELMHEVSALDDAIVKVVMTGQATVDNAVMCLREGAYDFITKPIDRTTLLALIKRAIEYHDLKAENARYQTHLEEMVRERSDRLAASLEDIQASYEFTLDALVRMLDAREHMTGQHSKRVRELAVRLSQEMGLSADEQETVARGAFLHDIGKIAIPDGILLKPGPLGPDEWKHMQDHSETGYNILRSSPYLKEAADIVLQHHEHFDGSGYPRGLKGDQIALGARIFHVIDAYDAMRARRVYRNAMAADDAVNEIRRHAGKQFDPQVVAAFVRCRADLDRIIDQSGD